MTPLRRAQISVGATTAFEQLAASGKISEEWSTHFAREQRGGFHLK
jgi:hypothetical protein